MESVTVREGIIAKIKNKSVFILLMHVYYKILHIFFCLDFGFFDYKSPKRRLLWKSVTIFQCVAMCSVGFLYELNYINSIILSMWALVFICHYILNVFSLAIINPDRTFRKLLTDLESIDSKLGVNSSSYYSEIKILLLNFLHVIFRLGLHFVYSALYDVWIAPVAVAIFYVSIVTSINLVIISYTFIFYAIYCRIKRLVFVLKTDCNIVSLQLIYKSIADLSLAYKSAHDLLFIITLLFNVPEVMAIIYYTVHQLWDQELSFKLVGFRMEYILVAEGLMLTFAPAICASMIVTQTDLIKMTLLNKLFLEKDATKIYEIERFIRYVEARPCRFRVWKVIPLDADLFGMVLSFCATYLIVIVQFTHK